MTQRENKWLKIGHRAFVMLRAIAGETFEEIEADHQHELTRANKIMDLVGKVGGVVGERPPKQQKRGQSRSDQH